MISLVTGSAGFIGSHLCRALADRGDRVIGLDLKTGGDIRTCDLPYSDIVFHLAAQTDAYYQNAWDDASTNILGSLRIFSRYRDKVVFASSAMVNYPTTPYAISKRACEEYAALYGVSVLRLCNITGPGGHSVFEKFEADETLTIYGDGEQLRTYATVKKAVQALIDKAGKPGVSILPGSDLTVNQIASGRFPHKPKNYVQAKVGDMADARQMAR